MARNEEKAQSMLYRFREAQAAELGLGTRSDRRPRMASACKSLRDCERWRGEILREISRKVSKIQDSGLTDYEVRDLNDEINRLLREKRHWENQIVALGGANYRRNVAMLDDDGKEVPGTKGYKYFGRAKDLPGVKELFMSKKTEEDEENKVQNYYKKFQNQGPAYFGDLDETDPDLKLLEFEMHAEEEEWEDAYNHLRTVLGLPSDDPIPPIPRPAKQHTAITLMDISQAGPPEPKRKAPDEDGDVEMAADSEVAKRAKTDGAASHHPPGASTEEAMLVHAKRTAAFIPVLSPEILMPPKLPTREEMEAYLLELRKKALVEEYFGDE
ncbi:pre-mRNA-splicing factor ISY1 [Lentinus brumalis]|uniref:Pre-mRNA-splicing factor ISY1 n=1 Tax=Lentinus brumalis TaxID=2498619 RepID=A0A371DGA9_9APHY|nr:pre-mRNA-splicing factor ISY1 [Polyporus brumalis]